VLNRTMSGTPRSLRIQWQGNGPVDQRGNDSLVVINPAVFLMKHYNDLHGEYTSTWKKIPNLRNPHT